MTSEYYTDIHSRRSAMIDTLGGEPALAKPPKTVTGHDSVSLNQEISAKRRKIRKGPRSCLECKRWKFTCIFASSDDITCLGCRRRRPACSSQLLALTPFRTIINADNTELASPYTLIFKFHYKVME